MPDPFIRLPAEWERQSAVILTWPHADTDWATQLQATEQTFAQIGKAILAHQNLLVVCHDEHVQRSVRTHFASVDADRSRLYTALAPSNDSWVRDHGPITVLRDEQAILLDFQFDGWGGKYESALDNAITARVHQQGVFGDIPFETLDWVLEGGSIESDGQGVLLTTESCLLDGRRNPDWDRARIEFELRHCLGFEKILWLSQGDLAGDDTDGHIDTLARFADPATIVYQGCDDPSDEHYKPLQAMAAEFAAFRRPDGQPYHTVPLPLPRPQYDREGARLPAGYANFLIINGAVLVPTYSDPADAIALDRLATVFPGRTIIPIDSRALIRQFGSLHCISMQLPAAVRLFDPITP